MSSLGIMLNGGIAWWAGFSEAAAWDRHFPRDPEPGYSRYATWYHEWLWAFIFATLNMVLLHCLSKKCLTSGEGYGDQVWSMLKAVPMYSQANVLSGIAVERWGPNFMSGAFFYGLLSVTGISVLEKVLSQYCTCFKNASTDLQDVAADVKKGDDDQFEAQACHLLGQSAGAVSGALAINSVTEMTANSPCFAHNGCRPRLFVFAFLFQGLVLACEQGRVLKAKSKKTAAREPRQTPDSYMLLG